MPGPITDAIGPRGIPGAFGPMVSKLINIKNLLNLFPIFKHINYDLKSICRVQKEIKAMKGELIIMK